MRRWLIRTLVCLILGAVATVGVSWGAIYMFAGLLSDEPRFRTGVKFPCWSVSASSSPGVVHVWTRVVPGWGDGGSLEAMWQQHITEDYVGRFEAKKNAPEWSRAGRVPIDSAMTQRCNPIDTSEDAEDLAAGWPMLALWGSRGYQNGSGPFVVTRGVSCAGWWDTTMHGELLPTYPIWKGFIVDTVVYAASFVLLMRVWAWRRVLRGWSWGREGRCRQCGYALAGLPAGTPCPECAKPAAM